MDEIENYSLDIIGKKGNDFTKVEVSTLEDLAHTFAIWANYSENTGSVCIIRGFINYTDGDSKEVPKEQLQLDYIF